MKSLPTVVKLLLFIILTTINVEYLINRQSNTLLFLLAVVIEIALIYILIIPFIKKRHNTEKWLVKSSVIQSSKAFG